MTSHGHVQIGSENGCYENSYFRIESTALSFWDFDSTGEGYESKQPVQCYNIQSIECINCSSGPRRLVIKYDNSLSNFEHNLRFQSKHLRDKFLENLSKRLSQGKEFIVLADKIENTKFWDLSDDLQMQWIYNTCNDAFDLNSAPCTSALEHQTALSPYNVVLAAQTSLEDFILTCEEYDKFFQSMLAAMGLRQDDLWILSPRVFSTFVLRDSQVGEGKHASPTDSSSPAQPRAPTRLEQSTDMINCYGRLYVDRMIFQLSILPNDVTVLRELDIQSVGASVCLLVRINSMDRFSFLSKSLKDDICSNLVSLSMLMDEYLERAIKKIRLWFSNIISLPISDRHLKLSELIRVVQGHLFFIALGRVRGTRSHTKIHSNDDITDLHVLQKRIVSCQLAYFCEQLGRITFSNEWPETALIDHITACSLCCEHISLMAVKLTPSDIIAVTHDSFEELLTSSTMSARGAIIQLIKAIRVEHLLAKMSPDAPLNQELLLLTEAFQYNDHILNKRIQRVSQIYVDTFCKWTEKFKLLLPQDYHPILCEEISHEATVVYIRNIINAYRHNKRMKLTPNHIHQIIQDLNILDHFLNELLNNSPDIHKLEDSQRLLKVFRLAISADINDAIICYSEAIQMFGINSGLILYDLVRLALKIRIDIKDDVRRHILTLCAQLYLRLQQLLHSGSDSIRSVLQAHNPPPKLLTVLCPKAGVEFCTGRWWGLETMPLSQEDNIWIGRVVEETCMMAHQRAVVLQELQRCTTASIALARAQERKFRIQLVMDDDSGHLDHYVTPRSSFVSSHRSITCGNNPRNMLFNFPALHALLTPRNVIGHDCFASEDQFEHYAADSVGARTERLDFLT